MNKSDAAIRRKKMIGFWWLAVVCFLSLIPLFLVAILANLNAVSVHHFIPLSYLLALMNCLHSIS
jgi:hypothetical protein